MIDLNQSILNFPYPKIPNLESLHNWDILCSFDYGPDLTLKQGTYKNIPHWRIQEIWEGEVVFKMLRNKVTLQRDTKIDNYGLLGVSNLNLDSQCCILTEGVSDYFCARLLFPNVNVLGVTTLTGSVVAKSILLSLFDDYTIISDNDSNKVLNTGLTSSFKLKSFLQSYGKNVSVVLPDSKLDLSDEFVFNLKLSQ